MDLEDYKNPTAHQNVLYLQLSLCKQHLTHFNLYVLWVKLGRVEAELRSLASWRSSV